MCVGVIRREHCGVSCCALTEKDLHRALASTMAPQLNTILQSPLLVGSKNILDMLLKLQGAYKSPYLNVIPERYIAQTRKRHVNTKVVELSAPGLS